MSDDNNVIQLSGQQPVQQQKNTKVILQLLDKNRKEGLDKLDKVGKKLDEKRDLAPSPDLEDRFRNLESGMRATITTVEALSGLVDVLVQDFMSLVQTSDRNFEATMYQGLHLQTLLKSLMQKGIISEGELETNWKDVLKENGIEGKDSTKV